ncbi:MAG: DUF4019 domain-containing protein [Acidobacteriota bacterium]|nr:DUF4019 domain-containing protein [Acidobacteriota bacterium]
MGKSFLRPHVARRPSATFALCLAAASLSFGCAVGRHRSGLPVGAQEAIDEMAREVTAGEFARVYEQAADEWRASVSAEENERVLARVRDTFGRVQSRSPLSASERGGGGAGEHTVNVSYNTRFERGDAVESFTLVERAGRWQLARYSVNSDALR